jgi:3-isopropylmalate/(R)-2-methylmalate dehydratase large subunit
MAMTITEKILAAHSGRESVRPGELLYGSADLLLGNDITAPIAIEEFRRAGLGRVFDPARVVLVPDHFAPNKDIKSAEQCRLMREFAQEQGLVHYYEVGRMGIEHALLPEEGLVLPGDVIIGADSHTCTYGAVGAFSTGVGSTDFAVAMALGKVWLRVPESYRFVYSGRLGRWVGGKDLILHTIGKIGVSGATYKAMEFTGETIASLPMDDRLTMCNMVIEAGAKNGIIAPDAGTREYVEGRAQRDYTFHESDAGADYAKVYEWDVSDLPPLVAKPHLPENVVPVGEVRDVTIDQVIIGSCTNGRLSDLQIAATILRGKTVHPRVRLIIIPATQAIYRAALQEGLLDIFLDAEAVISTPTCGPCLGGHMGVLAAGERALATTNRNFVGRMGHPQSEIYLSGPAVAAASAVTGHITHPDEVAG